MLYVRILLLYVRIVLGQIDRNGRIRFYSDRDVEENDRGLENRHPDQFLDQIVLRDHGMKPDHEQDHVDQVVQAFQEQIVQDGLKHRIRIPCRLRARLPVFPPKRGWHRERT